MPVKITNKQIKVHSDYFNFWPRWSLEKAEYDKAKITSVDDTQRYSSKSKGDLGEAVTTWPRLAPTEEITYNQFIDSIVDSKTNKFYPARDDDRRPLPKTGAIHAITDIIRLKTEREEGGIEFLLSKGTVIGHDAAGEELDHPLPWPERWFKTLFNWNNEYDPRSKGFIKRCLGPKSIEVQYLLPFTKDNAKSLFDSRASDLVNFVVKQENSNEAKRVEPDVNAQKTFERFANNSFDYLFSGEYIPLPVRQELRQEAVARGYIKGGAADYQVQSAQPSKGGKNAYG